MLLVGGADKSALRTLQRELAPLKRIELKAPILRGDHPHYVGGIRSIEDRNASFPERRRAECAHDRAGDLEFRVRSCASIGGRALRRKNRTKVQQGKPKEWNRESHRSCKPEHSYSLAVISGNRKCSFWPETTRMTFVFESYWPMTSSLAYSKSGCWRSKASTR